MEHIYFIHFNTVCIYDKILLDHWIRLTQLIRHQNSMHEFQSFNPLQSIHALSTCEEADEVLKEIQDVI